MKSLLKSATALAGIVVAGSAFAADLPRRVAPPPVFTPVPVFTWTGFYAGFNAGYGFNTADTRAPTVVGVPAGANAASSVFVTGAGVPTTGVLAFGNRNSNDGFVGGGQIGYNYQFTPGSGVVVGIEADAQYVDFGRSRNRFAFATVPGAPSLRAPWCSTRTASRAWTSSAPCAAASATPGTAPSCTPPAASPTARAAAATSA